MSAKLPVALRKESVDRNCCLFGGFGIRFGSLSARRAWIEISGEHEYRCTSHPSLSARRAWIEIFVNIGT